MKLLHSYFDGQADNCQSKIGSNATEVRSSEVEVDCSMHSDGANESAISVSLCSKRLGLCLG